MQTTDCGGSDFKKCVSDCASCNDNIDSCDRGILNVTCGEFTSINEIRFMIALYRT